GLAVRVVTAAPVFGVVEGLLHVDDDQGGGGGHTPRGDCPLTSFLAFSSAFFALSAALETLLPALSTFFWAPEELQAGRPAIERAARRRIGARRSRLMQRCLPA